MGAEGCASGSRQGWVYPNHWPGFGTRECVDTGSLIGGWTLMAEKPTGKDDSELLMVFELTLEEGRKDLSSKDRSCFSKQE